jgi:hypothetical protein
VETAPARTYDYTHTVLANAKQRAGKRWVVAVLRFGDTKEVENVPFGPASAPAQTGGGQVSVNVKVVGVENTPPEPGAWPRMPKQYREMLKHALIKSDAFTVVERERILEIIREINFGKTRYADPAASPDEGELLCVRYLIEGNLGINEDKTLKDAISKERTYKDAADYQPGLWDNIFSRGKVNREKMQIALRKLEEQENRAHARREFNVACYLSVYDVHTGEVVTTVMGLGSNGLEAIDDAVEEMIDELSQQDGSLFVAAVSGDNIYLDVGISPAAKVGARFQVIHLGKEIRDRNGQIVGREETEVGEIEITEVKPSYSIAKVVQQAGEIARGDIVKPAKH